ncbi:MAG: hypothetical protein JXA15_01170 [Spirochaetales bacterium]|nr:hypothetical protein [Spirochaetales bacterium]
MRSGDPIRHFAGTTPIEAWRAALLSGSTRFLIEAARNYLGPLRTPYNKHDLVSRLEAFMRRPDTAEALRDLLDDEDRKALAALSVFGPRTEDELAAILAPEGDEGAVFEALGRVAALRERLCTYKTGVGPERVVDISPPLAPFVASIADPSSLFGARPSASLPPEAWLEAETACAFVGVLAREPRAFGRSGSLSLRTRKRVLALLPELDRRAEPGPSGAARDRADVLVQAFKGALFLSGDGENTTLDGAAFRAAAESGERSLVERLLAGIASSDGGFGPSVPDPSAGAAFCGAFLEASVPGTAMPRDGAERLALAAGLRSGVTVSARAFVGAMLAVGAYGHGAAGIAPSPRAARAEASGPELMLEASMELRAMPGAGAAALCLAALVGRLEKRDRTWTLRVDRSSVTAAFEAGLDAREIIGRLEAATGRPVPQGAAFNLEAWERDRKSLRVYRGATIVASGQAQVLLAAVPAFTELGLERIAEGAWFVPEERLDAVLEAFERVGLPAPAMHGAPVSGSMPLRELARSGSLPEHDPAAIRLAVSGLRALADGATASDDWDPGAASARVEILRKALAALGAGVDRERELAERVARRLVLTIDQLGRADPPSDRSEVGALDHVGKVRAVERVLRSRFDLLELAVPGRDEGGRATKVLVRPLELRRKGDSLELRSVIVGDARGADFSGRRAGGTEEAASRHPGDRFDISMAAVGALRRVRILFFGDDDEREQ